LNWLFVAFRGLLFRLGTAGTVIFFTILVIAIAVAVTTITWNMIDPNSTAVGNTLAVVISGFLTPIVIYLFSRLTMELHSRNLEFKSALDEVKELTGLLPICASCKNIRDDEGYWQKIENYISHHTDAEFSHSVCPDCNEELYGSFLREQRAKRGEGNHDD